MIDLLLDLLRAAPIPGGTSNGWVRRHWQLVVLIWTPPLLVLLYLALRQALGG